VNECLITLIFFFNMWNVFYVNIGVGYAI